MKNLFICTACGETMDIEKLGSLNLARKLINYSLSKIKIRTARTKDGILFSNEILGLNCFCSHQADYRKLLRSELAQIIENVQNGNDAKALAGAEAAAVRTWNAKKSMVKKLTSTQDFMNMIEYV